MADKQANWMTWTDSHNPEFTFTYIQDKNVTEAVKNTLERILTTVELTTPNGSKIISDNRSHIYRLLQQGTSHI